MMRKKSELLTIQEASEMLNVHTETLRRWDNDGKLKAIKVGDRGDRRYRNEDVFMLAQNLHPITYKGYTILFNSPGFEKFSDRLGRVCSFIVKNETSASAFAFAIGGLQLATQPHVSEDDFRAMAIDTIKEFIDTNEILNLSEYTFEYSGSGFFEAEDATWWKKGGL